LKVEQVFDQDQLHGEKKVVNPDGSVTVSRYQYGKRV
jgi:hypothetical protein